MLRKNVFIRFSVEKHRLLSTVVIGNVHEIVNNYTSSEKVSVKFNK